MAKTVGHLTASAVFIATQLTWAHAAEIKVFSTIGVKSVLEEPKFENSSGHKLNITWRTAALLAKRVQEGEQADALVLTKGSVETLLKEGKIIAGTEAMFGQSIFAVGVKAGAPKPDISTADAFKKALLAAKAISYSNPASGGASGVYFAKQLDKMGIAEQMKDKTKFPPSGGFSGTLLASGDADIAIQSKPELLSVPGVDVVGPLPGDMAFTVVYAAGVNQAPRKPTRQKHSSIFEVTGSASAVQGERIRPCLRLTLPS
jgi:molybdate transport system substrate-binding protein